MICPTVWLTRLIWLIWLVIWSLEEWFWSLEEVIWSLEEGFIWSLEEVIWFLEEGFWLLAARWGAAAGEVGTQSEQRPPGG